MMIDTSVTQWNSTVLLSLLGKDDHLYAMEVHRAPILSWPWHRRKWSGQHHTLVPFLFQESPGWVRPRAILEVMTNLNTPSSSGFEPALFQFIVSRSTGTTSARVYWGVSLLQNNCNCCHLLQDIRHIMDEMINFLKMLMMTDNQVHIHKNTYTLSFPLIFSHSYTFTYT